MTKRSVTHSTFRIERSYDATPEQVFFALADKASKRSWFVEGEGWQVESFEMDFRPGGVERSSFRYQGGPVVSNDTVYQDIVENQRIVFAYSMAVGENRISASLGTIELFAEGAGTKLAYTEQGAFLDGHDNVAQREAGCRELYEALAVELQRNRSAA
ncbi:MAG: SRPBCC family protein [Mesorhizobium sp.]|jgi:uncharacterized protein YndB with AHSA1/START domain